MDGSAAAVVDVWSDYVCPFCYLELPVLERLKAEHGNAIDVRWHAFELRPEPVPTLDPAGDYLRTTWARSVYPMAAERGMALALPPVQPRSRKAFEAVEEARAQGGFDAMHRAIFRAFFEHGLDIGRTEVLVGLGREAGLDAPALRQALERGSHTERVQRDEADAQRLGIRGVPMMVLRPAGGSLRGARALSGAQPYESVAAAVRELRGMPA